MIEVEDKFRVHPGFTVPELPGVGPISAVSVARELTLTATYYDTRDLRLARAGITLRHRVGGSDDGWTLKLPVLGAREGVRDEILVDGAPGAIPPHLQRLVTAYARGADLGARATLRTERTSRDLLAADGAVLAELVDDRVDALTVDRHAARFREIEVEDRGGGSAVLDLVSDELCRAGAVAGEFQPKAVQALGSRATAAADPPAPTEPELTDPVRSLIAGVLRRHVRRVIEHDPGVRLETADAVHQVRFGARRLRSVLRDFQALLDPVWSRHLQDELRWLGRELSAARDLEVITFRLRAAIDRLPIDAVLDRADKRLVAALDAEAARATEQVRTALNSDRYVALLVDLVDAATHPRTTDAADQPCADVLPRVLARSWRRLENRVTASQANPADPVALHRVRIAAKRTRYLVAAMAPMYGTPATRLGRRLKQIQAVLGDHHDAIASAGRIRDAVGAPRPGRAPFTFGVLHAAETQAAESARLQFEALWPDVARPKHRRWVDVR